jgi:hypothetical protein
MCTYVDTIRTAASAGRMYVTTRSLPELQYDIPRPYADAPRDRIAAALAAYAAFWMARRDQVLGLPCAACE